MTTPAKAPLTDVTCLACGCLCDDITLHIEGNRIVEADRACDRGLTRFLADRPLPDAPLATIDGRPAARDEALSRAADLLKAARAPIVLGLSDQTIEAQAAAVALADRIGAAIDPAHARRAAPRLAAVQRVGVVGATLGEVRNRADVVVFWGVDPATTHRRHLERYSAEPRGRFVPEGRAGRTVLVADAAPTATSRGADLFLRIEPDRQLETLGVLRAMAVGIELEEQATREATGLETGDLRAFADRMRAARYGAFFHGPGLGDAATIEAALLLVRDLNATTRFVALTLGEPGNATGAEAVLAWQTGFGHAVDLAPGFPRYRPGEAAAEARLAAGAADVAILVGPPGDVSPEAAEQLGRIPSILLATDPAPTPAPTVGLAVAEPGIECGGTVVRCDGVSLPLRPALSSPRPTAEQWLKALLSCVSGDS